jgi:hypothetical protein
MKDRKEGIRIFGGRRNYGTPAEDPSAKGGNGIFG